MDKTKERNGWGRIKRTGFDPLTGYDRGTNKDDEGPSQPLNNSSSQRCSGCTAMTQLLTSRKALVSPGKREIVEEEGRGMLRDEGGRTVAIKTGCLGRAG